MKLSCLHCGQGFTITADQLGGRGWCPHCRGEIQLPEAEQESPSEPEPSTDWTTWWRNSISGVASLVIHTAIGLILALISFGATGVAGDGQDVLIGSLPFESLSDTLMEESLADQEVESKPETSDESLEVEPPTNEPSETDLSEETMLQLPTAGGSDSSAFELGAVSIGGGSTTSGSWEGLLQSLRRHGLDIVITFDSTGSMAGEIYQVKNQIRRIGSALMTLVPKARISLCTYRDQGDRFVVRGLPLTDNLQEVELFLAGVEAQGGGDYPEAVHEGMRWAIQKNSFRSKARKVILIFGDAPPHQQHLRSCLEMASDFSGNPQGIVSTVTCRSNRRLQEFVEIAQAGRGEAFLTADERQIMTQLIVLVFGSRHRDKVLEAFRLLER